jgi:antitoxin YefM
MIAADELASLQETAHLLRSPANAARLLASIERALRNEGEATTIGDIRQEVSLASQG